MDGSRQQRRAAALRNASGVSMLELCICLVILCLLSLPALQAMRDLRERNRLHAAASELYVDLQFARSESVRSGSSIHLSFADGAEGSCYWMHIGKTTDCACDSSGKVSCGTAGALVRAHWLPRSSATQIRSNVGRMTFKGEQGTVSSAATIEVSGKDGAVVRHIVSIMGRIRSCSPDTDRGALPRC